MDLSTINKPIAGESDICTTCIFGSGGHGKHGTYLAGNPDIQIARVRTKVEYTYTPTLEYFSLVNQCNAYRDIFSPELVQPHQSVLQNTTGQVSL